MPNDLQELARRLGVEAGESRLIVVDEGGRMIIFRSGSSDTQEVLLTPAEFAAWKAMPISPGNREVDLEPIGFELDSSGDLIRTEDKIENDQ